MGEHLLVCEEYTYFLFDYKQFHRI